MSFFTRLTARARLVDSLLCIGLDPHPEDLTENSADGARDFCLRLIEATSDFAAAFKPNSAFFEALGPQGMRSLQEVIAAVPEGVPVVLDAKRGDIASTAKAYAQAAFHTLGADAVTINPYLGYDALQPFLDDPAKGVFLLCKTSNPGASDLQDLLIMGGQPLYAHVAQLAQKWNRNDNLGLVVGATHTNALAHVRALAPHLWILAPGVGAQGGDLHKALRAGLRDDGLGLLVPVSRAIARAENPSEAAQQLRQSINQALQSQPPPPENTAAAFPAALADALLEAGCIQFGEFTLKSGLSSPIYIDLRRLAAYPHLLGQVAAAYLPILRRLTFDQLAALPYAALPIATAISLAGGWPLVYPRKEVKAYGTQAAIEGVYQPGQRVVMIDDLITTGGSKLEALGKLTAAGLLVADVVVLVDRQSGAEGELAAAGCTLHAVFTLTQLLDHWETSQRVPIAQIAAVRQFLAATGPQG